MLESCLYTADMKAQYQDEHLAVMKRRSHTNEIFALHCQPVIFMHIMKGIVIPDSCVQLEATTQQKQGTHSNKPVSSQTEEKGKSLLIN